MDRAVLQVVQFADSQEWDLIQRNVHILAVPTCKMDDLLMLSNSVFTVRNVVIWAVLSSNEVD